MLSDSTSVFTVRLVLSELFSCKHSAGSALDALALSPGGKEECSESG